MDCQSPLADLCSPPGRGEERVVLQQNMVEVPYCKTNSVFPTLATSKNQLTIRFDADFLCMLQYEQ